VIKNAVLLIGSPREGRTTSWSLGDHLLKALSSKGVRTCSSVISQALAQKDVYDAMMKDVTCADLIVLSFPIYADAPPADVVRWMELVRDDSSVSLEGKCFLAIGNCDDPDPSRIDTAMMVLRNFAESEGMSWAGGARVPMGPAIGGAPLKDAGRRGGNAAEGLEMAAEALVEGKNVPEEALEMIARHPMSELFYVMHVNKEWKRRAVEKGGRAKLDDRPLTR